MNKIDKKNYTLNFLIIFSFLIINIICIIIYLKRRVMISDFAGNRTICGYVLYGFNPYNYIGKAPAVEGLGSVLYGFGNLPFGLLLGNLFYFGFLNYDMAFLCYKILTVVLLFFTLFFAYRYFKKYFKSLYKLLFLYFVCFSVFSINLFGSLWIGNAGHLVCMCIIIAIFTIDDNKIISGIFLSLAMIKPQITVPFCIFCLLYKKFIPLLIAAIIDIIASFICAFLVKENVIDLFLDFLTHKTGGGMTSYGIFTIFCRSDYYRALFPSMLFGVILIFICYKLLKCKSNNLIIFSIPALIANVWSYTWSSDYYILILPAMACVYAFLYMGEKKIKNIIYDIILLLSVFVCLFIWCMKHVFIRDRFLTPILMKTLNMADPRIISYTYCYIIVLVILFMCIYIYNKLEIE